MEDTPGLYATYRVFGVLRLLLDVDGRVVVRHLVADRDVRDAAGQRLVAVRQHQRLRPDHAARGLLLLADEAVAGGRRDPTRAL